MKIFVCEFITSGGFINQALPARLAKEGNMMLSAVINDLQKIKGITISTTIDSRMESNLLPDNVIKINLGQSPFEIWGQCFIQADACIIIAPETDNILFNLHKLAEENNCLVLGCSTDVIKLSGSKFQCIKKLQSINVLTPKTISDNEQNRNLPFPLVLKSDDGVGCENCYLINNDLELENIKNKSVEVSNWVKQEIIHGIHASLCILAYGADYKILSFNQQNTEVVNNQYNLNSIVVNGLADMTERFEKEINKIISGISGLSGIFGIDCVVIDKEICVLEINPRLTTSYCGLSESLNINPVEYLLDSFKQNQLVDFDIHQKTAVTIEI